MFDFSYGYVTSGNAKNVNFEINEKILGNIIGGECNITSINQINNLNLGNISNLKVSSLNTDVKIISTKDTNSSFHLYGRGCNHTLVYEIINETMNVYIEYPKHRSLFSKINTNLNLEIKVPENHLNQMVLDSISGDINGENLDLDFCEINTVSGDINLENILCTNSFIETTSGDINQKQGSLEKIKTTSGDINLENININKNSNIETISGDVNILSDFKSSFKIIFNTVSGDFNGFRGNGDEKNTLFVKSTSGDLEVY